MHYIENCFLETLFSVLEYEALSMSLLIHIHEFHLLYEKPHIVVVGLNHLLFCTLTLLLVKLCALQELPNLRIFEPR